MAGIEWIIVLGVAGFLLLAAEVFIPGMVLGILGTLSLVASIVIAFLKHGTFVGSITLVIVIVGSIAGFFIWMALFPRTSIGRKMILSTGSGSSSELKADCLLGQIGEALTPLRPAGTILLDGRKLDVISEGELVEVGDAVEIIRHEGLRTIVRKTAGAVGESA
jgi:membrane-bound serine protease (ClpP class)